MSLSSNDQSWLGRSEGILRHPPLWVITTTARRFRTVASSPDDSTVQSSLRRPKFTRPFGERVRVRGYRATSPSTTLRRAETSSCRLRPTPPAPQRRGGPATGASCQHQHPFVLSLSKSEGRWRSSRALIA